MNRHRPTITLISMLAAALLAGRAQAATIAVDEAIDDDPALDNGACSLREAVIAANTNSGVDTCVAGGAAPDTVDEIVFDPALDGTPIALSIAGTREDEAMTGDLDIREDVNIIGNGIGSGIIADASTIVDGNGIDRVIGINGGTVLIEQLILADGDMSGFGGGGIAVSGVAALTLRKVMVTENRASSGGGIFASGDLTLENSAVFDNVAETGGGANVFGGGIIAVADLTIRRSIVQFNEAKSGSGTARGGGIGFSGDNLVITESLIANNTAATTMGSELPASSGGLQASGTGNVRIERSAIMNNSVRAAGDGPARGGGVTSAIPVTVANSTIIGNSAESETGNAQAGGWFIFDDSVSFNNVSFLGNSALSGTAASGNVGGIGKNSGTVSLSNTALIGNSDSSGEYPDCGGGPITSANYNILGDNTGCDFTPMANDQVGDVAVGGWAIAVADVFETGRVMDNGGGFTVGENFLPQATVALSENSPALDAGDPNQPGAGGTCETTDQRGVPRPEDGDVDGGAVCDIGALEAAENPIAVMFDPAAADTAIAEDAGSFLLEGAVRLSIPSSAEITVDIVIGAASGAESPADFEQTPATATFAPGATRADLEITPVDDGDVEDDETIVFNLDNPVNALGTPESLTLTLLDNDEEAPGDTGGTPPRRTSSGGGGGAAGLALLAALAGAGLYRRLGRRRRGKRCPA